MNERITTCGIIIENNKVLVAKRSVGKSTNNLWEFVGGKNRYDESEEETLKREFLEELNLDIEVDKFLTSNDFVNNDTLYHLKAYLVKIKSGEINLSVHSEVKYVDKDELLQLDFVPSDKAVVTFLIEKAYLV